MASLLAGVVSVLAAPVSLPIALVNARFAEQGRRRLAGLALLGAMGVLGVALVRRATGSLDSLELIAYGFPFGIVAGSLVMLAAASVAGTLRGALILGVGVVAVGLAVALWRRRQAGGVCEPSASDPWGRTAVIVIALLLLRWAVFWRSALVVGPDGLWAGSANIWGDWLQHLGDVTAFIQHTGSSVNASALSSKSPAMPSSS